MKFDTQYVTPGIRFRRIIMAASSLLGSAVALLSLLWLLGGLPVAPALAQSGTGIIRVATTGSDTSGCGGDGSPCATVQYAVDQALPGEEIRVAAGRYTDTHIRAGITQVVYISKTVTVRGGYTTSNWNTPDPEANPTTLDAQGLGRVLVIMQAITPTIEGLRITGGNAAGLGGHPWAGNDAGGGVYIYTATATISGCVVFSNTASTTRGGGGGGVFLYNSGATLNNSTVASNTATTASGGNGGGLFLYESDATLQGNTVQVNTTSTFTGASGGGLYLWYSDATLQDNTVVSNTASTAGGASGGGLQLEHSAATLQNNTVQGNIASTADGASGGGVYLNYSNATLQGNTVVSNTASTAGGASGGGVYLNYSNATLQSNTVQGNIASTAAAGGSGGGLFLNHSDAALQGNTVQGNIASTIAGGSGGGLQLEHSAATLSGNTIISNTATLNPTASGVGGGLYVTKSGSFTLTNNLLAANHANSEGGGLGFAGSSGDPTSGRLRHTTIADNSGSGSGVYVGEHSTLAFTNTIIAGHSGTGITVTTGSAALLEATLWYGNGSHTGGNGTILTGTANVYGDPVFVDPMAWDYHLDIGSAAVDIGVNAGVTTDIDGDPRPRGLGYDAGVDELFNQPPVATAVAIPESLLSGTVTLDGSASSDPEGEPLTYGWTQTGGTPVSFTSNLSITTFTAPAIPGALTFTLTVTDSLGLPDLTPAEVVVTVEEYYIYLPLVLKN